MRSACHFQILLLAGRVADEKLAAKFFHKLPEDFRRESGVLKLGKFNFLRRNIAEQERAGEDDAESRLPDSGKDFGVRARERELVPDLLAEDWKRRRPQQNIEHEYLFHCRKFLIMKTSGCFLTG